MLGLGANDDDLGMDLQIGGEKMPRHPFDGQMAEVDGGDEDDDLLANALLEDAG